MATIKLSALISDIRGKSNGSYFAKRNNSIIMANNPYKSGNKSASSQSLQTAKNNLGVIAAYWQHISDTDQIQWNNAASLLTWYTKTGEPYTPTGYQYFNQIGNNMLLLRYAPITTPPIPGTPPLMTPMIATINTGVISVEYNGDFRKQDLAVYASWSNSYGSKYPKGGYKLVYTAKEWEGTTTNITEFYNAIFGALLTNGYCYFRINLYEPGTGILNGSKLTKADSGYSD
jgi:hypothetical protein